MFPLVRSSKKIKKIFQRNIKKKKDEENILISFHAGCARYRFKLHETMPRSAFYPSVSSRHTNKLKIVKRLLIFFSKIKNKILQQYEYVCISNDLIFFQAPHNTQSECIHSNNTKNFNSVNE